MDTMSPTATVLRVRAQNTSLRYVGRSSTKKASPEVLSWNKQKLINLSISLKSMNPF